MNKKRAIIQLLFAIVITLIVFLYGGQIKEYSSLGYLGAFIISLISSATVIIPAPGWIAILELGRVLDPLFLAIVAGIGASIGELTGYFAGSGAIELVNKKNKLFEKHKELIKKHDFIAILLLAFIPNPIFDIAGITAGALNMDLKKFLIACMIGKIVKFFLIAYLGLFSLELV